MTTTFTDGRDAYHAAGVIESSIFEDRLEVIRGRLGSIPNAKERWGDIVILCDVAESLYRASMGDVGGRADASFLDLVSKRRGVASGQAQNKIKE